MSWLRILKITKWLCLVAAVLVVTFNYVKQVTFTNTLLEEYNHAPCTYHELRQAFPAKRTDTMTNSSSCWTLQDQVLRLRASAIANRNHMRRLGSGSYGSVFEAIVRVNGGLCSVAVKTDQCRHPWTNPFEKSSDSCVDSWATNIRNESTMGAEYAGALVFEASKYFNQSEANEIYMDGFMPTWGVVQDVHHLLRTKYDVKTMARYPLVHQPLVRAVVMPFLPFTNLEDVSFQERTRLAPNATAVARLLLPAAKALQFVNGLGFAFGDILEKNVAIVYTHTPYAKLFDNSKFKIQKNKDGTIHECSVVPTLHKEACNYCMEPDFPTATWNVLRDDFDKFKAIIVDGFLPHCQDLESAKSLSTALASSATIGDVVNLLQLYQ